VQLLLAFSNCHGHGDSCADHGVVAHAQETHHFHVKSACRRLCYWAARVSAEVIISFFHGVIPSFKKWWYFNYTVRPSLCQLPLIRSNRFYPELTGFGHQLLNTFFNFQTELNKATSSNRRKKIVPKRLLKPLKPLLKCSRKNRAAFSFFQCLCGIVMCRAPRGSLLYWYQKKGKHKNNKLKTKE